MSTRFLSQFSGDIGYPGMVTRRYEVPEALRPSSAAAADGRGVWIAPATGRLTYGAGEPDSAPLKALISWRLCSGSESVVQLELFWPAAEFDRKKALEEEARFVCLPAAERGSFDVRAGFERARRDADAGGFGRAADEIAPLLEEARRRLPPVDPDLARIIGRHADYAVMAGRGGEVERDLNLLQAVRPPTRAALLESSRILRRVYRPEQALEAARQAAALGPRDAETLGAEARAYNALGRYADAIRDFQAAAALSPKDYWLKIDLAKSYRLAGRFEEAAHLYKDAREASPREAFGYFQEGYSRVFSGDQEAGTEDFAAVVSSHPDDPLAHHHYGAFLFQSGRYDESRRQFEEARRLFRKAGRTSGTDYAHTMTWLARLDDREGRAEAFLSDSKEALDAAAPYSTIWAASTVGIASRAKDPKGVDRALDGCERFSKCSSAVMAVLHAGRAAIVIHSEPLREADAARVRADLEPVLAFVRQRRFGEISDCVSAIAMSGRAMKMLEKLGDFPKAEEAGKLGLAAAACAPAEFASQSLRMELADLYRRCGDGEKAAALWREALRSYRALDNVEGVERAQAMLSDGAPAPGSGPSCGLSGARK